MAPKERPPTELFYFSFHAKDWLSSRSVRRMSREERGDFIDLLAFAWGNGTVEPSLEENDFGPASERVKAQWKLKGSRFYNEKLSAVWRDCQLRHDQAVRRGKASAKARRDRKRLEGKPKQSPNGLEQQSQQRPLVMGLEDHVDPLSRGAGAVPDGGPAPAVEVEENGARDVRRGGGLTRLTDLLPASLRPRPA